MFLENNIQLEIRGSGVVPFRMERGCMMRVEDVLFVPGLRYSVIFISIMERKGFEALFQDGKERLKPKVSNST